MAAACIHVFAVGGPYFNIFVTSFEGMESYSDLVKTANEVGTMAKEFSHLRKRKYILYLRDASEEDHVRNGIELFISTPSRWGESGIKAIVNKCRDLLLKVAEKERKDRENEELCKNGCGGFY